MSFKLKIVIIIIIIIVKITIITVINHFVIIVITNNRFDKALMKIFQFRRALVKMHNLGTAIFLVPFPI